MGTGTGRTGGWKRSHLQRKMPEDTQANHMPHHHFTSDRSHWFEAVRTGCQSDIPPGVPYRSTSDICENTFSCDDEPVVAWHLVGAQ